METTFPRFHLKGTDENIEEDASIKKDFVHNGKIYLKRVYVQIGGAEIEVIGLERLKN